jgi:integrase
VRGSVYRQCWCRDPATKKRYPKGKCPKLKSRDHGKWYARYDSATESRRQPILGPFEKKADAEEELAAAIAREGGGSGTRDRQLRTGVYLDNYMAGKRKLKPKSRARDQEAFRLYWKPALGVMRLVDVRDVHVSAVITAMEQVNRPLPEGEEPSEMLRRMLAARADDERRELPEGEARGKKSTRPLTPATIERMYAPFRAAMNAAVKTKKLDFSPCTGVELPDAGHQVPLAWTQAREARFRKELAKRELAAAQAGPLTTVERQALWAAPDLRPVPAMVWMPDHTGDYLDYLDAEEERMTPLFAVAAYCGLRQDELLGLAWAEVDLPAGTLHVRKTGSGSGPKSESGFRVVPIPADALGPLRAWRKVQAADRLAWGRDWPDTDLVFTHEDGRPLSAQWVRVRFMTTAFRRGLPPVRFHDLRHGTASFLKRAGVESRVIAEILGHKRSDFTERVYVTIFDEAKREASDRGAAVVPRRRPRDVAEGS